MAQASLSSPLLETAAHNTPQLQLVILQIFTQLKSDRDIARSQYQMAKFQLGREEDRCRKEQARRITLEHQMNEHTAQFQLRTQAALETAAEVERLLEKAKQEAITAKEQANKFKELSHKKDIVLSSLRSYVKLIEKQVSVTIKDANLINNLTNTRRTHMQFTLGQLDSFQKKLTEITERMQYYVRVAEEREVLLTSANEKNAASEREVQLVKDQLNYSQEALLAATERSASCEALHRESVEEVTKTRNLLKEDRQLLVQSWVTANATEERLRLTLAENKNLHQLIEEKDRLLREAEEKHSMMMAKEMILQREKEMVNLQETQQLLHELQVQRNKSASFQLILAQNVTSALTNLSKEIISSSNSQTICEREKLQLLTKINENQRKCDERHSETTRNIVNTLDYLRSNTNEHYELSKNMKETLLANLQSQESLRTSLQQSFSSSTSAQIQLLQNALQSHHLNMTKNWDKYIIIPKENLKKLPYITKGKILKEALFDAARKDNVTEIQVLLDAGVDIESYDERYKETPLIWAAEYGKLEACRYLLERGAYINAKATSWGNRTPLHAAAVNNRMDIIPLLVELGADLSATDNDGKTPAQVGNDNTKAWFSNRSG